MSDELKNDVMPHGDVPLCAITSGEYLSILRRLYFGAKWWLLLLPVVACLALAALDSRFLYVALIVAMGVVIVVLPLIYIYYALTQESRWSILEKTVTLSDDGIVLDFADEKMNRHIVAWADIKSTTAVNGCLIVKFKKNNYTFLAIPLDAFAGADALRAFVKTIHSRLG